MEILLAVCAGWFILSIPVGLVMARVLAGAGKTAEFQPLERADSADETWPSRPSRKPGRARSAQPFFTGK